MALITDEAELQIAEKKFQSMNYHLRNEFAITITIKPHYCKNLNHVDQYKIFTPFLVEELNELCFIDDLELVAELTKQNNIHYHGLLKTVDFYSVQSIYSRIKDKLKDSVFGYIWVTHVSDKEGWIKYMSKNPYEGGFDITNTPR